MKNCPTLNEIIQAHDYPVLKFLKDIRIKVKEANLDFRQLKDEQLEFKLQFFFSDENPYFENSVSFLLFKAIVQICQFSIFFRF